MATNKEGIKPDGRVLVHRSDSWHENSRAETRLVAAGVTFKPRAFIEDGKMVYTVAVRPGTLTRAVELLQGCEGLPAGLVRATSVPDVIEQIPHGPALQAAGMI
jgi:hypothetical protein